MEERTKKVKAGKDLINESLTLKCITMAPNINTAIPIAEGTIKTGKNIPIINVVANKSFKVLINCIKLIDNP